MTDIFPLADERSIRERVMYTRGYLNALDEARDCLLRIMPGKLGEAATPDNVAAYIDELKAMRRQAEAVLRSFGQ